jgi:hypothetical protein
LLARIWSYLTGTKMCYYYSSCRWQVSYDRFFASEVFSLVYCDRRVYYAFQNEMKIHDTCLQKRQRVSSEVPLLFHCEGEMLGGLTCKTLVSVWSMSLVFHLYPQTLLPHSPVLFPLLINRWKTGLARRLKGQCYLPSPWHAILGILIKW